MSRTLLTGAAWALAACATDAPPSTPVPTAASASAPAMNSSTSDETRERNKQTVRRIYETAVNQGRFELLDEIIAPEFSGALGGKGPPAFRATVEGLRVGFPDVRFAIEDLIAEGDRVMVRWKWTGTHKGEFRGFPASQKVVTDTGIAIYRFEVGKVIQAWLETDRLGLLQQIGVVSPIPALVAQARAASQTR